MARRSSRRNIIHRSKRQHDWASKAELLMAAVECVEDEERWSNRRQEVCQSPPRIANIHRKMWTGAVWNAPPTQPQELMKSSLGRRRCSSLNLQRPILSRNFLSWRRELEYRCEPALLLRIVSSVLRRDARGLQSCNVVSMFPEGSPVLPQPLRSTQNVWVAQDGEHFWSRICSGSTPKPAGDASTAITMSHAAGQLRPTLQLSWTPHSRGAVMPRQQ